MENRNLRPAEAVRPAGSAPPPRRPQNGQPQGGGPRKSTVRRAGSESRWFRAILMVIATIALCFFLAIFALESANDMFGLNQEDQQVVVKIPSNASLSDVSSILADAGVVGQQLTFQLYSKLKSETEYQPGEYVFNANMGYEELLIALRTGDIKKEEVRITFIEGENIYEIAKELESQKVCGAEEFLECLQSGDFGYEFMDQLPDSALRFRRLEGYVFPDTYDFFVGEKVDSVARKFLRNFDSKITSAMKAKMNDLNLTLDEAITLASIIQKEAGTFDEMKRVSSVFHNRLNFREQYPKLQSDVTKIYAQDFIVPFHQQRNQPMYDAYNTYEREGLPIGPICNPGLDAIEAALYPVDTSYYFFVTDAEGQFYYSETIQQHYEKIRLAAAVQGDGEVHGIDTE